MGKGKRGRCAMREGDDISVGSVGRWGVSRVYYRVETLCVRIVGGRER